MSKQRKIWVIIGFSLGGLLTILSAFVPGAWCMDGCSSTPPNYQMLVIGITLLLVTAILRRRPATDAEKLAFKESSPETSGDLWPARGQTNRPKQSDRPAMSSRSGPVGCVIALGAVLLLFFSVNGWTSLYLVFMLAPIFPFFLIGLIVFAIVRSVSKRNGNKSSEKPQESNDSSDQ